MSRAERTEEVQNEIGCCRGTSLEEPSENELRRASDMAVRALASARQAQRQRNPEIANALEGVAREKLTQAARLAELNGAIKTSTKENVSRLRDDEREANREIRQAALKASEEAQKNKELSEARDFFYEASRDNVRNAEALRGLQNRYF